MPETGPDFSLIIADNEAAAGRAFETGNFVHAYLLVHALVESLLRAFLGNQLEAANFCTLVDGYKRWLQQEKYPYPTFANELVEFNRRRNRIVHQLWRKGFSFTNRQAEPAARAAVVMYGLLIEWLADFQPEIVQLGFEYDNM
ncbi:MAG TPA: hypothetical protein VM221_11455 [Armatimonadota bacterium]|nr:hypothetical protein [Armatimonadota bacterium]